jgi:hypothetical protein
MERFCENSLCENQAVRMVPVSVNKPSDEKRALCTACEEVYTWGVQQGQMSKVGLQIEPPPKEKGPESLYRVVYAIDVNAPNPQQAAERAYEIMKDAASLPPVLEVLASSGRCTRVDLSPEGPK